MTGLITDVADGSDVVARVQDFVRQWVPEAVCELQDYGFRIGCGVADDHNQLHEIVFLRKGLTSESVEFGAHTLLRKLHPTT
jgi:hypothetical protein